MVNGFAELAAVDVVEAAAQLGDDGVRWRLGGQVVEADQSRDVEHAVVHLPSFGTPRGIAEEAVEQHVGIFDPRRT